MQYAPLGETGLRVSRVALGGWQFAGDLNWGPQDDRDSAAAVAAALDHGVNFFDTAEAYGDGRAEEVLGRALERRRQDAVIASKTTAEAPEAIVRDCEASLRRLGTDVIDLYQIHWPPRAHPVEDALGALERLKEQGKIRATGVSNFGAGDLAAAAASGVALATNQLPYSLLWRAIEFEVLPATRAAGLGVLAYSVLVHGLLTGKFETADDVPDGRARTRHFSRRRPHTRHGQEGAEALTFDVLREIRCVADEAGAPMHHVAAAWVLSRAGVTSVVLGARDAGQVEDDVKAAGLRLEAPLLERLDAATAPLKHALGPNPDMWQSDSRYR